MEIQTILYVLITGIFLFQFSSVKSLICDPMDCSNIRLPCPSPTPGASQTHVHRVSDAIQTLIICRPLLLLPSVLPSIKVFSNKSVRIRWPKYWSFIFNISTSNEYSGLISFRINWFDLLVSRGLSRVFSKTTAQKHQFFSAQLSLWSKPHIHT